MKPEANAHHGYLARKAACAQAAGAHGGKVAAKSRESKPDIGELSTNIVNAPALLVLAGGVMPGS